MRRQLTGVVAATTSLVLLAFLVPLGLLLRSEAEQRAISAATLQAQSLAALVALDQSRLDQVWADPSGAHVSIFLPDGRVLGAPATSSPAVELARRGQAFTAESSGGVEVLVPVQGLPGGTAVIRSFVPDAGLHQGVLRTWSVLALLGLGLFVVGLIVADRLGRRLVGSVTALAGTAERLSAGDLGARSEPDGPPEVRVVGAELNRLAARIGELLAAERESAADLAHRLRTPVTALRLDLDSLRDPDERARLSADVDALSRSVDEVIRAARRPGREGARPSCDLVAVVADRVSFWTALAEDTGRAVECVLPPQAVPVRAAYADLTAALDALLENVFTHTPDGTPLRVEVVFRPDGGGTVIVDDAGPGFANRWAQRGHSGAGSTGLGLDIARRAAEASGGGLSVGTGPLGGARVTLCLGPPS
ncbi:MAG: ATP-binding protein [Micromonosporaceae bacterium]